MKSKPIDLMHRRFGRSEGKTCGECLAGGKVGEAAGTH